MWRSLSALLHQSKCRMLDNQNWQMMDAEIPDLTLKDSVLSAASELPLDMVTVHWEFQACFRCLSVYWFSGKSELCGSRQGVTEFLWPVKILIVTLTLISKFKALKVVLRAIASPICSKLKLEEAETQSTAPVILYRHSYDSICVRKKLLLTGCARIWGKVNLLYAESPGIDTSFTQLVWHI